MAYAGHVQGKKSRRSHQNPSVASRTNLEVYFLDTIGDLFRDFIRGKAISYSDGSFNKKYTSYWISCMELRVGNREIYHRRRSRDVRNVNR